MASPEPTHGELLDLSEAPPYYVLLLAVTVSPVIQAYLFGPVDPNQSDKQHSLLKTAGQWWTLISFLWMVVNDVQNVVAVLASGLGAWRALNGAILAIAVSPNLEAAFAFAALANLHRRTYLWLRVYGTREQRAMSEDMGDFEDAIRGKGLAAITYYWLVMAVGMVPACAILLYTLPAFVAYAWIFVPMATLLLVVPMWLQPPLIRAIARRTRGTGEPVAALTGAEPESPERAAATAAEDDEGEGCCMAMSKPDLDLERSYADESGAPLIGWRLYFILASECFLFVLLAPMASRLYSGNGYWRSLTDTLTERTLVGWVRAFVAEKVETASQAMSTAGSVRHAWDLGSHWVRAVNWFT